MSIVYSLEYMHVYAFTYTKRPVISYSFKGQNKDYDYMSTEVRVLKYLLTT